MSRPDILHIHALPARVGRSLSQALTFAFARGVDEKRLSKLAEPPVAPSHFSREAFADDLFLEELVRSSFPVSSGQNAANESSSFFLKQLVAPPRDLEDLVYRQGILRELSEFEERRESLSAAFAALQHFRETLSDSLHLSSLSVGVRRRIDILVALRRAVDALMSATGSSRSGLECIATWVEQLQDSDPYRSLVRLLSFEDGRSVLETRLQVGYDGTLTRFEIVSTSVASHQAFPRSALARFFRRVASLFKGYRFSEEDIMSRLLDQVFLGLEEAVATLLGLSLQIEFYLRALNFRSQCEKQGLSVCLPKVVAKGSAPQGRALHGLFNPWIVAQGATAVPCDFVQGPGACTTIVTGPNSGGKTRLLQSLAITQLLGQAGLFVPARQAVIPEVEQLFLSLLEHNQSDQKEGRLGVELMRVRDVFEHSGPCSLVLMDELCSGTNPSEGERIFEMVLELFEELRPQVLISTHFLDFAGRLCREKRENLAFLQVEMDEKELPTYQFISGVATTSLARNTASRLGVTREELLALIRRHKERS